MAAYSATAWPSSFRRMLNFKNLILVNNRRYPWDGEMGRSARSGDVRS
jgi:hypothetical protein